MKVWFYFDQLLCKFVDEDSIVSSVCYCLTQSAIIYVYHQFDLGYSIYRPSSFIS